MAHILIVDDEPEIRRTLRRVLERRGHSVEEAADVAEARAGLAAAGFDLMLCDISMPGGSGLDLLRRVAEELVDTAIVMVTAADDPAVAEAALELGACGYLVKPFRPNELVISIASGLHLRDLERARRLHLEELESKVLVRTTALHDAMQLIHDTEATAGLAVRETADRLVTALTLRSEETGGHIQRMSRYGARLAALRGIDTWSDDELRVGMMLHDVGKIGVPDAILLKPGALTEEEFDIIKRHPQIGADLLAGGLARSLVLGVQIALTHHERWDGAGYPAGLVGEAIPIEGRIATIADVFDALTSDRVYRAALPIDQALEIMVNERAKHFDPELLDCFLLSLDDMVAIRDANLDPTATTPEITVLVLDTRPMFAEALVRLLRQAGGVSVVGVGSTPAQARTLAADRQPDVIVLDVDLDGDGVNAVEGVGATSPRSAVILLASREDDAFLVRTLETGGAGVIQRDRAFEELVPAVLSAAAGKPILPAAKLLALLNQRGVGTGGAGDLTPRELEILRLMADGRSNEALAGDLNLSLNTVRNHVQRILTKLGAHSKLEAVAAARRGSLLPPS